MVEIDSPSEKWKMRKIALLYSALSCDYDGTLAANGAVAARTIQALERVARSNRLLILVTGRIVKDLQTLFPAVSLFAVIVAENGGILYWPASDTQQLLTERASVKLVDALLERGVRPLSVGEAIVATSRQWEPVVRDTLQALNITREVSYNKDTLTLLPPGVDKGTGFASALKELGIASQGVVGIGDAENDLPFLHRCGWAVAVANALPIVKSEVDMVTQKAHGAGVVELIEHLLDHHLLDHP